MDAYVHQQCFLQRIACFGSCMCVGVTRIHAGKKKKKKKETYHNQHAEAKSVSLTSSARKNH